MILFIKLLFNDCIILLIDIYIYIDRFGFFGVRQQDQGRMWPISFCWRVQCRRNLPYMCGAAYSTDFQKASAIEPANGSTKKQTRFLRSTSLAWGWDHAWGILPLPGALIVCLHWRHSQQHKSFLMFWGFLKILQIRSLRVGRPHLLVVAA